MQRSPYKVQPTVGKYVCNQIKVQYTYTFNVKYLQLGKPVFVRMLARTGLKFPFGERVNLIFELNTVGTVN